MQNNAKNTQDTLEENVAQRSQQQPAVMEPLVGARQRRRKEKYAKPTQIKYGNLSKIRCVTCSKDFDGFWTRHYCSTKCEGIFRRRTQHREFSKLNPGAVGAINEARVIADLLGRGYEVFKGVSAQSTCDLIIMKRKRLLRIEVRTGYMSPKGNIVGIRYGNIRADLLAIVAEGKIIYQRCLRRYSCVR